MDAIKGLDVNLKIIGLGSLIHKLKDKILKDQIKNVIFLGFLSQDDLHRELSDSMFTICPSICQESFSYSIAESFCLGKPVIASNIGAFKELIIHNKTGLLFEPGNVENLRNEIKLLLRNPRLCIKMGKHAREYVENMFDQENFYLSLIDVYNRIKGFP